MSPSPSPSPPVHVSSAVASSTDERSCLKRMAPVEDAGTGGGGCFGLNDDLLLHVFANYMGMADLLRCAATCRRWRRLVAGEAEFICRRWRRLVASESEFICCRDRHVAHVVVGFFHQTRYQQRQNESGRFLPSPSTWPAFLGVAAVNNNAARDLFKSSRLVASRRGCLLLELRGAGAGASESDAAGLRLSVVNLTTGGVFNLPSLAGNDRPERYACAFVSATDLHPPPPARSFAASLCVILLYKRGNDDTMACRSCSSDTSAWGPERTVTGANVSRRRLAEMGNAAGVAVGGTVFWLSGKVVFGLRVDTLRAAVEAPKWYSMHRSGFASLYPDRRLTVLPDGRLGAVQLGRGDAGTFVVNVFARNDDGKRPVRRRWEWEQARDVDLDPLLPPPPFVAGGARMIRLGAVCEENGLVFFATMDGAAWQEHKVEPYALDLEKKKVQATLVRHAGSSCFYKPSCRLVAFVATTPVAYLTSLDRCVR